MRFRLILIIMLILLPVLNDRQPAHADSIIGNGTPYSCTDAAFTSALQSGGTLRFDCGSQPVTIDISPDAGGSGSKLVKADTIMDGGTLGQITISGGHAVQLFDIAPGVSLMIRNLILRDGADKGSAGAIHNGGTLNISHSTLSRNVASNGNGGAIENSSGASLTIADSTFSDNSAHSDDGSQYVTGGAIQNNGGLLAISNTIFTANLVINDGNGKQGGGNNGGAINNFQGTLRIDHSVFTSNAAIGTSTLDGKGGAISSNNGTITLTNVVFRQNTANYGGAYHGDFDQFTVRDTTFAENQATTGSGGAIDSTGGMLNVFNSTFSDNLAEARFGGAIGAGRATVMIANSTFANNSAQYGGAVQINNKPSQLTVLNSTFAGNKASNAGAALYNEAETTDNVQVMIANSIIAKSQAGDNCNAMIRSGGHNIEDGNTCQLTAAGDQPNTTPLIGMLGENDGPTQTIPLTEKSPAIAAGDTTICAATPVNSLDQRGVTRLQQGHCDIGAFEFAKDVQVSAPGLEATLEATSMMRNGGNNCASITGNFMKTDGSVFCFHGKAVQLYG